MNMIVEKIQGSYLQSIAYGIVLLAQRKKSFKEVLLNYLRDHDVLIQHSQVEDIDHCIPHDGELVIPINHLIAQSKLAWLINETKYVEQDERDYIFGILNLVDEREIPVPKAAAWGIVFNETLGPTLGDVDLSSRLDYSQVIILKSGCKVIEKYDLAKSVNSASLGALDRCFEVARYDFQRLEPEVISWLSDSRNLEMYFSVSDSQFANVLYRVNECRLNYFMIDEENSSSVLALQPSINGSYCELVGELVPVE